MRPRLLHLGYGGTTIVFSEVSAGFNEAEAFTPRIRQTWANKYLNMNMLQ